MRFYYLCEMKWKKLLNRFLKHHIIEKPEPELTYVKKAPSDLSIHGMAHNVDFSRYVKTAMYGKDIHVRMPGKKKPVVKEFSAPAIVKLSPIEYFTEPWSQSIKPSVAEQKIIDELNKHNVRYLREVSFTGLLSPTGGYMRFDFFIPDANICIEYQGEEYHSTPEQLYKDKVKKDFCNKYGIKLIAFTKTHYYTLDDQIAYLVKKHL